MKRRYLLNLFLLVLFAGCKKSNVQAIQSTLIGKWTYTEYYYSSGVAPGEWHTVSPPGQTIEFKSDATFIPCESFQKDANQFEIVDSVTVTFQPALMGTMEYSINTIARELVLTPRPHCIEGCAWKFKR